MEEATKEESFAQPAEREAQAGLLLDLVLGQRVVGESVECRGCHRGCWFGVLEKEVSQVAVCIGEECDTRRRPGLLSLDAWPAMSEEEDFTWG